MKNKSFKNLVIGIGITNFGDSLFMIAIPIIIYAQTQNDVYVSISAMAAVFPILFGFLLGPLINRLTNKRWLIRLQIIQMIAIAFVFLNILIGINLYSFSLIVLGLLVFSFCNYCSYILTQAIVPKIVEESELSKSNSIVASSRNIVNGIADGISGILIVIISYLGVLIIDLLTYAFTILFFRKVEIPESKQIASSFNKESKNQIIANYKMELKNGLKVIFNNSFTIGILLFALIMQMQTSILAVTSVGFFSEANKAYLYGFYFATILIGFSIGSLISNKVRQYITAEKFIVLSYSIGIVIWIASMLIFKEFGLLIVVFMMSVLSGIFEVFIVTKFQLIYKETFGNVMTLFMAISSIAQLSGLLLAPAFITLIGYYNLIIYASLLNILAIGLYLLSKLFIKESKEANDKLC